MDRNYRSIKFLFLLILADRGLQAPSPDPRSTIFHNQPERSSSAKLVELKLPVKITSMEDLVAWAQNAMRSMASRIDITLESVDNPDDKKSHNDPRTSTRDSRSKNRDRENFLRSDDRRPVSTNSLISNYADFTKPKKNSFVATIADENEVSRESISGGNVNAYLPLFLDDDEISRYREEALRKYYLDAERARTDNTRIKNRERTKSKYSQSSIKNFEIGDYDEVGTRGKIVDREKLEKNIKPVISVPFEAIVTITRENANEPIRSNFHDNRDPPDVFPPYFERDYTREDATETLETMGTRKNETSKKRQISTLGDLLRMLGFTKKLSNSKKGVKKDSSIVQSNKSRPGKPVGKFTPPPLIQFDDEPPRQRRNQTSQRQELDDDEDEEPTGSLGSITDLLPLVIPILEDISDPNTQTDLGEVLEAALPLVQGLSEPSDDPDAPDLLSLIGPILTKIIGGKDGQGSDVGAILGPALTLVAPLIGPVLGPIIGPLISTISNPPQAEGSSLATLLTAILAPLTQPTGEGGMSPLSILTAGIIAALSKELRPGLPGGLDVGAVVGSVLSGVIAGTSAGLSGSLSSDKNQQQPYGPYGAGPLQAGSVNTGTSTGYVVPGSHVNSYQHSSPTNQQSYSANDVEYQGISHHTTRRPYSTLPQRLPPGPAPRPSPPNYAQSHVTGPLTAGTTNTGTGDSSYLPYGTTNAVPANSANPIGLIGNLIKDILGAGVQVGSSVINAVFGILGSSSSSDEPKPVYGPPPQSPYGKAPR